MDPRDAVTHVVVFALGVGTWLPFTLWEGRQVLDRLDHPEEHVRPPRPPRRRLPILITVLLVAAALMVGFGVQQARYQADASERQECYETWGRGVIDTLETRLAVTSRVERAEEARADALDNIILTVTALRARPPEAVERDLDTTLSRFAAAKARLERVTEQAARTRSNNPYPQLRCNG